MYVNFECILPHYMSQTMQDFLRLNLKYFNSMFTEVLKARGRWASTKHEATKKPEHLFLFHL